MADEGGRSRGSLHTQFGAVFGGSAGFVDNESCEAPPLSSGMKDEKQNISNDSSQALLIADFHLSKRPFHVRIIIAERLRPHEGPHASDNLEISRG